MSEFSRSLKKKLKDPEFRKEFMRVHSRSDVANQLIILREKRGLTQTKVAEKMESTQAVISRMENALGNSSFSTIQKYAEALNAFIKVEIIPEEDFQYYDFFLEDYFGNIKQETKKEQDLTCLQEIYITSSGRVEGEAYYALSTKKSDKQELVYIS
jgi:transcriptional regulator with XRE-family HTH domain